MKSETTEMNERNQEWRNCGFFAQSLSLPRTIGSLLGGRNEKKIARC